MRTLSWIIVSGLFIAASPALAHEHVPLAGATVISMEERVKSLEENQVELYHTLQEKKEAGLATRIAERITLSGLLEVEAFLESLDLEDGASESASDLVLATVQLGLEARVAEGLTGEIILLFEEDQTEPLDVDEATINFERGAFFGRFGRQYLPFGVFHSHFISDPLTLELGETRETALLVGFHHELLSLSLFGFNGDAEEIGEEDHLRDWGGSLVVTPGEGIELGASFLSDLADTDAELLGGDYTDRVAGWSASALVATGRLSLSGEILGALEDFSAEDGGGRPLAWNLEAAVYPVETVEVAARLEGSDDFAGHPALQYGADVSWALRENVTLSLEYLRGEFEDDEAYRRDLVSAQLALEF